MKEKKFYNIDTWWQLINPNLGNQTLRQPLQRPVSSPNLNGFYVTSFLPSNLLSSTVNRKLFWVETESWRDESDDLLSTLE